MHIWECLGQTYRSLAAMLVPFDVLENSDCNFSRRLMCLNFTVIIEIFYLCTPELKKGGGVGAPDTMQCFENLLHAAAHT